jgi:PAS domain S-box-containing protein
MEVRTFHVGVVFFAFLALSFLLRGGLSENRTARAYFLRMGGFFVVYGCVLNATLFAVASGNYQQGTWTDLLWTISYCVLIVIAAAWDENEQDAGVADSPSRGLEITAQFTPLLIPAVVFSLALQIAREQFYVSVLLVLISFAAASGRLFVVQRRLLSSTLELQRNLALLRGITEGTTDSIFVKDLQGRYLMINSAGARLLGRTVKEVIGRDDTNLFSAETAREIMAGDRKVVEAGKTQTYEEIGAAAGVSRTYLSTKGPYRDVHGETVGLLGICRDITDRKRAEEESRQSQQKLRIHFEHTPLAVIEWDTQLRITEWSPSAERVFGYTRAEAIGCDGSFLVPSSMREHVAKMGQEILKQKGGTRSANDNVTKDGRTISCEWYNTPLVDESGNLLGVASLVQDVTERVALEEKLRQSQRMEAIGRVAGGVAHDFNNLLTVIMGYSQILTDGLPPENSLADATVQIRSAANRAAGITRQLLAFSRKQVLSPRVIDLNNVMLNLDTMLRRLIGEDIEVLTVPGRDLGTVKADPGQVEQIIMNLALNARDAMPNGGKLTLETENTELDNIYARNHEPVQPGRYVMLALSDTGIGMSPDIQSQMFEPFFTTKEVGKGTGLGLSTVYGIVKQSGGYIWVYSELGHGTTFKIYLPRVDQPAEELPAEKRTANVQRGTETILLVEDDAQLRQLASGILGHCGYRVLAAASSDEGLALCRENQRDIHLLITDVVMPGLNGRELAERVSEICPNAKVLYISGYTSNAIVHYGVLDAGLWFLPKPFSLSSLIAKVREVLDSSPEALQQGQTD